MSNAACFSPLQPVFGRLAEASFSPRQMAAMVGFLLQNEANRAYAAVSSYEGPVRVAYDFRDIAWPNAVGYVPAEAAQRARKTTASEEQRQVAIEALAPFMTAIHGALAAGRVSREELFAISMAFLAASNGTEILVNGVSLNPDDGAAYFDAMVAHSLSRL